MNTYALPWSIPDLLCPGAPVVETGESGLFGARGTVVRKEPGLAGLRVWWETGCPSMVTSLTGGTALDIEHPLGRAVAVAWLRARTPRVVDAILDAPALLAWSIRSVACGGPAIDRVLRWRGHRSWSQSYGVTVECYELIDENGKQVHAQRAAPTAEDCKALAVWHTAVFDPNGPLYLPPLPGVAS